MLEHRAVASSAFSISLEHVMALLRGEVRRESASDTLVSQARRAFARGVDEDIRLRALQQNLGLDALDLELVAVLLAAEVEPSLEKVFSFAIDDFTKKRPDATFLVQLIGGFEPQLQDAVRARLDHAAPLKRLGVVLATGTAELPASARSHRLNDRVVSFLRGQESIDELVHAHVRESRALARTTELVIDRDALEQLRRALDRPAPRILIAGPDGVGKALAVEVLRAEQGESAIRIDLAGLVRETDPGERIRAAIREAALRGAAAVFEGPGLSNDLPTGAARALADASASVRIPIILALTTRPQWPTNTFTDLSRSYSVRRRSRNGTCSGNASCRRRPQPNMISNPWRLATRSPQELSHAPHAARAPRRCFVTSAIHA